MSAMEDNIQHLLEDIGEKFEFLTSNHIEQVRWQVTQEGRINELYRSIERVNESILKLNTELITASGTTVKTELALQGSDIVTMKETIIRERERLELAIAKSEKCELQIIELNKSLDFWKKIMSGITLVCVGTFVTALVKLL